MMGSLVRAVCYTVGYCVVKLWTTLVFFWCSSVRLNFDVIRPQMYLLWFKWNTFSLWLILLPIDAISVWYTPGCYKEGCINTSVSCVNRGLQGFTLVTNVVIGLVCINYLSAALSKLKTGGTTALFSLDKYEQQSRLLSAGSRSSLDDNVESIFAYDKYPNFSRKRMSAHLTSERHDRLSSPELRQIERNNSTFENNSKYRMSSVELSDSLLDTENASIMSSSVNRGEACSAVTADNDAIDEIMKRQTMRIVVYVFILLLLTLGVIMYDINFCAYNDTDEIMYMSPPCSNKEVVRGTSNMFYTGNNNAFFPVECDIHML